MLRNGAAMSLRCPLWSAPPSKVEATSGDVHVWRAIFPVATSSSSGGRMTK